MNWDIYFLGVYAGICFVQGMVSLRDHVRNKPYLLAFAIEMFGMSAVIGTEVFFMLERGMTFTSTLLTAFDHFLFPLFYLEVLCLTNQDVDRMGWAVRIARSVLAALPILGFIAYVVIAGVKDDHELADWVLWSYATYIVVMFSLSLYHLRRYHLFLEQAKDKERRDIKWVFIILILMACQYVLYGFYDYLPSRVLYYLLTFGILLQHAYFVGRQLPANTRKLRVLSEKLEEQQRQAIDELKDATAGMKRRMDMDTALKAYRVEHPGFEERLKQMANTRLTARDVYLSSLIADGKRIAEIAECLAISPASVEVARHRLRNKLALDKGENMNKVLQRLLSDNARQ